MRMNQMSGERRNVAGRGIGSEKRPEHRGQLSKNVQHAEKAFAVVCFVSVATLAAVQLLLGLAVTTVMML